MSEHHVSGRAIGISDPVLRWMSRYPREHIRKMLGELHGHHEGATFELMIHAMLKKQGFRVTVISRTPDFHVVRPDGLEFDIEATAITVNPQEGDSIAALMELGSSLSSDAIDYGGTSVTAEMEGFGEQIPYGKIRRFMKSRLTRRESGRFTSNEWGFSVDVDPHMASGLVGVGGVPLNDSDDMSQLVSAIEIKANRYDPGHRPYVLAVCIKDPFWVGHSFHDSRILSALKDIGRRYHRISGLWLFYSTWWLKHSLRKGESLRFPRSACYYPNPYARNPLANPFPRMRRYRWVDGGDGDWVDGESIAGVLGLSEGWPQKTDGDAI